MTSNQTSTVAPATAESIEGDLTSFLAEKAKTSVQPDQDLFASGLVSSMFAMQLVVQLESTYDIAIIGPDLKLDNFRTVQAMTDLVLRLRKDTDMAADA
jgi:methoxymalonate biosynthesis acyl carrier protein